MLVLLLLSIIILVLIIIIVLFSRKEKYRRGDWRQPYEKKDVGYLTRRERVEEYRRRYPGGNSYQRGRRWLYDSPYIMYRKNYLKTFGLCPYYNCYHQWKGGENF